MKYLRQLIQHIISESLDNSHSLAVSIKQGTHNTEATLYDTGTLQRSLPTLSLEDLSGTHRATAGELEELTGISQDSLDSLLNGAGNWFFSHNYRG